MGDNIYARAGGLVVLLRSRAERVLGEVVGNYLSCLPKRRARRGLATRYSLPVS